MRLAGKLTVGSFSVWILLGLAPASSAQDCSIPGQNAIVRDILFDWYLWYRELPSTDPALFDSPEACLEAVRFRPLDTSFSFISFPSPSRR